MGQIRFKFSQELKIREIEAFGNEYYVTASMGRHNCDECDLKRTLCTNVCERIADINECFSTILKHKHQQSNNYGSDTTEKTD